MKSLVVTEPGTINLQRKNNKRELKPTEVTLNVIYGGICGSDVSVYKGKLPHATYPVVAGHEIIGKIIAIGEKSTKKIGQRVVIQPNSYCGHCSYCIEGKTNVCQHKNSLGINNDGGFKEQFTIDEKYTIDIPDALSNERAILIEPLSVIVHGLKKCKLTDQTKVAVIGCGTEGMLAIALSQYLGSQVTAIDINEDKLMKIKEHYPNVTTYTPMEVPENYYDVVVEVAGATSAFEQTISIAKPTGHIVAIGFPLTAEIPVVTLVRKELTIHGSIIYNVPEDFTRSEERRVGE